MKGYRIVPDSARSRPVERKMEGISSTSRVRRNAEDVVYWLTPLNSYFGKPAAQLLTELVADKNVYAFGRNIAVKAGDWICFYVAGKGVMGHARVISQPDAAKSRRVTGLEAFPWVVDVDSIGLYTDAPVPVDEAKRNSLDAFKDKNKERWNWFVMTTHKISERDFQSLTRHE